MSINKENESKYIVVDFNRFRGMHFFGHPHQGPPAGPPPVVAPVQPNPVDPIV
jgi:hypothetical protein